MYEYHSFQLWDLIVKYIISGLVGFGLFGAYFAIWRRYNEKEFAEARTQRLVQKILKRDAADERNNKPSALPRSIVFLGCAFMVCALLIGGAIIYSNINSTQLQAQLADRYDRYYFGYNNEGVLVSVADKDSGVVYYVASGYKENFVSDR